MNQVDEDIMRDEYDFSRDAKGTHHKAYEKGTNVVLLDPDVAQVFKDSVSVNQALRTIARLAKNHDRD